MKTQKHHTAIAAIAMAIVLLATACASSSTMPKRKKSRCNTCPKFSYTDIQNINNTYDYRSYSKV